jgi:hypothetical protein
MTTEQRTDVESIFEGVDNNGTLDYVCCWYMKAAEYMKYNGGKAAFVSTNSVSQGEQVDVLWRKLIQEIGVIINFAHRTFKWSNEAKGVAAVYCVIIGFSFVDNPKKELYDYPDIKGDPFKLIVKMINPYLVEGKTIFLVKSNKPISAVPKLIRGSIPYDDGHLLMTEEEYKQLFFTDPTATKFVRRYGGSQELIRNKWRYCLWLVNADPTALKNSSFVLSRIEKVRKFRESSSGQTVKSKAYMPSLFGDLRQPAGEFYLLIPRHSSERRKYIPIGFISQETILADSAYGLPNATLFHFGVLTSEIHMTWVRYTCGRIKSDYRYSKDVVYNNYPWPLNPSEKQMQAVEEAAQAVLDARAQYPESSLADLYDPNTMPPVLVKAHQQLDKAVDLCYRPQPFPSEAKRIEYLFELYEKYTGGLFQPEKKTKKKKEQAKESQA